MADTTEPKKTSPESTSASQRKVVTGSLRPDLATLLGLGVAMAGILGGLVLEKGSIWNDLVQGTAAMIVLGGTFGAVLVTTPLPVFLNACKRLMGIFFDRAVSLPAITESLIQYATKARKNGIVSLEMEAAAIPDPFLRKALSMAVDGTDLQEIRTMMETDINLTEQVADAEAKVWEAAGGYAPTVGIIGAVMGLIQVMKHLEDIKEVGHGIAVAFVATVYGVGSANIFFLPAASKLRARMREASLLKEMTLEGVVGIVEGLNPTLIRMKLEAFHPNPGKRANPKAAGNPSAAKSAPDPKSAPQPAAAGN
jgi:chemotaxis protein MotA